MLHQNGQKNESECCFLFCCRTEHFKSFDPYPIIIQLSDTYVYNNNIIYKIKSNILYETIESNVIFFFSIFIRNGIAIQLNKLLFN